MTESLQVDLPPQYTPSVGHYEASAVQPSWSIAVPGYTESARSTERLLNSFAPPQYNAEPILPLPHDGFVFRRDNIEVDLGPRTWTHDVPSYGSCGVVRGLVRISEDRNRVDKITVTLKGAVKVSVEQLHLTTNHYTAPVWLDQTVLNETYILYSADRENQTWKDAFDFALHLPPTFVASSGERCDLPPSSSILFNGARCDVMYSLQLEIIRKGFRKRQSLATTLWHLPKTRPPLPPLTKLPEAVSQTNPPIPPDVEGITTIAVPRTDQVQQPNPSGTFELYLTLPSPSSFISGQPVPVLLSLICSSAPEVTKSLSRARICLVKRLSVRARKGGSQDFREVLLSNASSKRINLAGASKGYAKLLCELKAGESGQESSWAAGRIVNVEYIVRVIFKPHLNETSVGGRPVFRHDEFVQVCTDPWDTIHRELASTGGIPAPAIGLAPR